MGVAIAAAQRAEGRSAPNPPVGCAIINKQGRLVAVGHTARGGRPHAETTALAATPSHGCLRPSAHQERRVWTTRPQQHRTPGVARKAHTVSP